MKFNENILHYIWKFRLFDQSDLRDAFNQVIEIINPGTDNLDSGPDFSNAKIKIDDTIWVGNVEIHIRSSDWFKHSHEVDKAYDNVILHVVWVNDKDVYRSDKTKIPTIALQNLVDASLLTKINQLIQSTNWIACENQIKNVDVFVVRQWLDRMLVERLEHKSRYYNELYESVVGNWEDVFYIGLARSFGFKVNNLPFEVLAKNLSQQILAKHKNSPLQIEALVFGVSGLLNSNFNDEYPQKLKNEFDFLKAKYKLSSIDAFLWKFSKTRPDNFPTIRLAQFAALVLKSTHLFSKIIEIEDLKTLKQLFTNLKINEYWEKHYVFDKDQKSKKKELGELSIDSLLINTVIPLLYAYGKQINNDVFLQRADNFLNDLKAEKNIIVNTFATLGIKANSAYESQALLQLKNFYCKQKKCLNCSIGIKILKP